MNLKKLCVFCGSAAGNDPKYMELGRQLGVMLAKNKIALVYGGASIGLMGAIADSVMENGGTVIGVIPKALVDYEVAHSGLSQLFIVDNMHQRKQLMYDNADLFLSLPGGMGTLDEMFEVLTWTQLKYHQKPSYILNFEGFYDSLLAYLKHSNHEGFVKNEHLELLTEIKVLSQLEKVLLQGV
ncbi:MAG: TIGR00730 family Rossman fold protein [Bdellovibrionales bacterium]|nr:TIGR00730 family Rossman fold protein [Bdellovibrionales bacterium]